MSSKEDPKFALDSRPPRLVLVKPAPNRAPRFIALSAMIHAGGIAAVLYLSLPVFQTTKTETIAVEIGANGSAVPTAGNGAPTEGNSTPAPAPAPGDATAASTAQASPATLPPPPAPEDLIRPEDLLPPSEAVPAPEPKTEPPVAKAEPVETFKPQPEPAKQPAEVPKPKPAPKPVKTAKAKPAPQPKLLTAEESPVETAQPTDDADKTEVAETPKPVPVETKEPEDTADARASEALNAADAEVPKESDDSETQARVVKEQNEQALADAKAAEKARQDAEAAEIAARQSAAEQAANERAAQAKAAREQAARDEADRAEALAAANAAIAKSGGEADQGNGKGQVGAGAGDAGEQIAGTPTAGSPGGVRNLADLRQRPGNPKPSYSEAERMANQHGEVTYQAYIDSSGAPVDFKQVGSTGYPNLDQKTLDALKQWKFYPGQEGWVEIPIRWDLKGGTQERSALARRKYGALNN